MTNNYLRYYNGLSSPFKLHGLVKTESGRFHRLPDDIIGKVNDEVTTLAKYTAGGRIRFKTNSVSIALSVTPLHNDIPINMSLIGTTGCDIYVDGVYRMTCAPKTEGGEFGCVMEKKPGTFDIEINLPPYNGVVDLRIGLNESASVEDPTPYISDKPILFYGSSITQGASASRPGNAYTSMLARWLNVDHINLGFSGSGRGEAIVAEYIASLDLSAFIMDYDHNAPNVRHLEETHERFFKIIREKRPNLPVIMISKPDTDNDPLYTERLDVIHGTYENAKVAGDENVYFIDGSTLFGKNNRDACTVDGCHPNDLGFMRMAEVIRPVLERALCY